MFSPLIPGGQADLVIALERHEALRGLKIAARDGGTLVYYNTVWQPLDVRLGRVAEVQVSDIQRVCRARDIKDYVVFFPDLESRQRHLDEVSEALSTLEVKPWLW